MAPVGCCMRIRPPLGCRTTAPDWNGTWKLNPTKSSYQGQILTISVSPGGEYRFDESSSHTLRCDGRDRPIGDNRTVACVKSGVTALDITQKENGVKTKATHDELSTDGRIFTTTVTEFRSNESGLSLTNTTSFRSLTYDLGPQWQRGSFPTPMGNTHQTYSITARCQ
jgi:hypothetical protein